MSLIKKVLRQTAYYWAKNGVDAYNNATFAAPVQIACRWEDVAQEFLTQEGGRRVSSSVVMVDRDMPLGSMLMLDSGQTVPDSVGPLAGALPVLAFTKKPNLRATEFLRIAHL